MPGREIPGAGGSKGHADMVGHLQDGIQMRVEGRSRCHCEFQTLSVSTQALSMDVGVLEAPGHVGPITSIHRVGAGRWKAAIRLTPPWQRCPGPGDPAMSAAARGLPPSVCSPTWLGSCPAGCLATQPEYQGGPWEGGLHLAAACRRAWPTCHLPRLVWWRDPGRPSSDSWAGLSVDLPCVTL